MMRTVKVIIIVLVLALLAVMLFCGVRNNRTATPAVSIQIIGVTNYNTVVQFRVSNPRGLSTFLEELRVEERDNSTPLFLMKIGGASFSTNQNTIHSTRLGQPLSADKAYRVLATFSYRGVFEQNALFWLNQHVPVLCIFIRRAKKEIATSEWFKVRPEASGTNMGH
jgi:hypothetical protein